MALSTYSELQSAVADWLNRDDLAHRIRDFISLAEAGIATRLGVRTAEVDTDLLGVAGGRTIPLPTGYRDAKAMWIVRDGERRMLRMTPASLLAVDLIAGEPGAWCVDGVSIAFDRRLDRAYSFTLRKIAALALSDDAPTNLILANYPNLYLFGALREAGPFLRDVDLAAMFEAKYAEALAEAKDMESRADRRVNLTTEPGALIARTGRFGPAGGL